MFIHWKSTKFLLFLFSILILLIASNLFYIIYYSFVVTCFALFGVILAIHLNRNRILQSNQFNSKYQPIKLSIVGPSNNLNCDNYFKKRTLISDNVDELIEEIIDLCLRDFIYYWFDSLVKSDKQNLNTIIK